MAIISQSGMNCCSQIWQILKRNSQMGKDIEAPREEHRSAWLRFDQLLMYRANICMLMRFLQSIIAISLHQESF